MSNATFTPSVHYEFPKAALLWLENAFGFEITMAIDGPEDQPEMCHYEMSCAGSGTVMIGGEWNDTVHSPSRNDGINTQSVHVQLNSSVDEHFEHAQAAGATIVMEPTDQFYGDRTYRAVDPEGHQWVFSQKVRDVSRAEAEAALGQKIVATDWQ